MAPGALEAEARSFGELFDSPDAKEGLTAFVEKRPASLPSHHLTRPLPRP